MLVVLVVVGVGVLLLAGPVVAVRSRVRRFGRARDEAGAGLRRRARAIPALRRGGPGARRRGKPSAASAR